MKCVYSNGKVSAASEFDKDFSKQSMNHFVPVDALPAVAEEQAYHISEAVNEEYTKKKEAIVQSTTTLTNEQRGRLFSVLKDDGIVENFDEDYSVTILVI